MTSRGTPKDILRNYGWEALLHMHSYLTFCAIYNKHKAAVSTGHKGRACLSFATIQRVTAVCKRNTDVKDMALRRATLERTAYASAYLAFAIKAA